MRSAVQVCPGPRSTSAFSLLCGGLCTRGCSSAGRAPALQAGGHRFEPDQLHDQVFPLSGVEASTSVFASARCGQAGTVLPRLEEPSVPLQLNNVRKFSKSDEVRSKDPRICIVPHRIPAERTARSQITQRLLKTKQPFLAEPRNADACVNHYVSVVRSEAKPAVGDRPYERGPSSPERGISHAIRQACSMAKFCENRSGAYVST